MTTSPKRLFVTDLDGTLLQNDATLSPYARERLLRWLEQGMHFTIATARSVVSVRHILGDLPLRLPIVCANGAYLSDYHSEQHYAVQAITKPKDRELLTLIRSEGFHPFVSTYDGKKDGLYMAQVVNEAMEWYLQDRIEADDERLQRVADLQAVMDQRVICFNVMERWEPLKGLEQQIRRRFGEAVHIYFYENWYSPEWYWLSVYDLHATKGGAIQVLMEREGLSDCALTVFGDNLNDLSMFRIADQALAMAEAKPELKALSTATIGTNQADGVIRYISEIAVEEN